MKLDLLRDCTRWTWDKYAQRVLDPIDCGEADLNDFFENEATLYSQEMLGRTYVWVTDTEPHQIVSAFTVSNDSIKSLLLPKTSVNKINRQINNNKRSRTYPAVLIGRLGVSKYHQHSGDHIGTQTIEFIKDWFTDDDNKTGCRFLLVDAYNKEAVLNFYERCGFKYLYKTEQEEKEYYGISDSEQLRTRMMYYDLK